MSGKKEYSIEETEYGVLVFGTIPLDEFARLTKDLSKRGMNTMALGVASAKGALIAVCKKENLAAWEADANKQAAEKANGDPELEWLYGTDVGSSSKAIFAALSEKHGGGIAGDVFAGAVPRDPDDFGRCYRLLERIAGWRQRLPEVAERFPEWLPYVAAWESLEELWREENISGKCPKLYDKMKKVYEESRLLPRSSDAPGR